MGFEIKPATRSGVIPLVSVYGSSGGGKTMSALLLMRGIVGPKGRITLVDSESGRGSLFADIIQVDTRCWIWSLPFLQTDTWRRLM